MMGLTFFCWKHCYYICLVPIFHTRKQSVSRQTVTILCVMIQEIISIIVIISNHDNIYHNYNIMNIFNKSRWNEFDAGTQQNFFMRQIMWIEHCPKSYFCCAVQSCSVRNYGWLVMNTLGSFDVPKIKVPNNDTVNVYII